MPHSDPSPSDPLSLNGVVVETAGPGSTRQMAACFIEELFRLGHSGGRILAMFNSPQYRGPYLAKEALGEGEIKQLIEEQMCRRAHPGRRSGPGLPPPEHRPDGGAAGEDAETSPSIVAL